MSRLTLFSPSGVVVRVAPLRRAVKRLAALGFAVQVDEAALARHQRFAGDDATRLAAIHRVADDAPRVALATRGGYGLSRLLDAIDWARLARSVRQGTRWVGYSDLTALHLALWAHAGVSGWSGPLALDDFGRADDEGGTDEVTIGGFVEAMAGELEAIGFRTEPGFDGLDASGPLWGGNLTVLMSLLGTRHWPARRIRGGVLFLEDVAEHPYRVERMLLQLHQAGVLDAQRAVLLGDFGGWKRSPHDRGYGLRAMVAHLRAVTRTPILTGLPIGHVPRTKVCLPVGRQAQLVVDGRNAWLAWGHA
ncbi:MAG: LD-carboxypeptidase [Burkholderiaceae bacterium]|nr:LD-carboxypeptidase [Burkholderiaceae bacterium]